MSSVLPPTPSPAVRAWVGAAGLTMALVCALGPLELRGGALHLFGLQLSAAELFGGLAVLTGFGAIAQLAREPGVLGSQTRSQLRGAVPLTLLIWAVVSLFSALVASDDRLMAVKFALRVGAGVALALVAALLGGRPVFRRRMVGGLLAGLGVVTLIALAERIVGQGMEPFLRLFRDEPTWMLGEQRLSAVFYHANTFSAYLELTIPFLLVMSARSGLRPSRRLVWGLWLIVGGAMLSLTYSRAGLLAVVLSSLVLAFASRRPGTGDWSSRRSLLMKAAFWFALGVSAAYLINPDMRARLGMTTREYRVDYRFFGRCNGHVGDKITVPVTVINRGQWPVSNRQAPGQIAHVFWRGVGHPEPSAFRYLDLPELLPGEKVELLVEITLPKTPGWATALFDIRRKKVLWISSTGNSMGRLRCLARPEGMDLNASYDPPSAVDTFDRADPVFQRRPLELSRLHYWAAAGRIFTAHPWFGAGTDRFRFLYRDYVPPRAWDPRARAHSIVIETAADLGLLGLLALGLLVGALGASLFRVFRAQEAAGPIRLAAAAAIVGFGLHSLVDYFLGYTEIYLIAWPILGLASAPFFIRSPSSQEVVDGSSRSSQL